MKRDMTDRIPVVFNNADGHRLFGIYHPAAAAQQRKVGVILLSPGIKARIAPHRMYLRLAEMLAMNGWPVLRFDFSGLGDSEGGLVDDLHAGVHAKIQVGRYVDDTVRAMDWMVAQGVGSGGFVLGGLCGGAITGLLTASDTRVKGLLALGIPVMLDDPNVDSRAYVSAGQLKRLRDGYFKRMKDPDAWLRLLSFRTDYRMLMRSIFMKSGSNAKSGETGKEPGKPEHRNPLFAPAMMEMMQRGQPVCCVFGGNDRLTFEFEEQFLAPMKEKLSKHADILNVHNISYANHIFGWREWESEMLGYSSEWFTRWFGEVVTL